MEGNGIFRADESTIAAIIDINATAQPGVYPLSLPEITEICIRSTLCSVALDQGIVRGYLIAYSSTDPYNGEEFAWFKARDSSFLYIDQVAVAEQARRSGIGAELYRHAAEYVQQHNLSALVCEVNLNPPNPVSLAFHARCGFKEIGVLSISDGRTVSLQRKSLLAGSPG